jgi:hypothetical protein
MTEAQPPTTPGAGPAPTRIGNAERQQAMDALDVHMSAGRLDPDEYGERVGQASVARTTADLEPLFVDLPAPHGTGPVTPVAAGSATTRSAESTPGWVPPLPPAPVGRRYGRRDARRVGRGDKHNGREPLGGRVGEVAVGASPFIALILFFATVGFFDQAWLFFLLIPLVGVVVYGRGK